MEIFKNLDDRRLESISGDEAETLTNEIDKSCQFWDEINNILMKTESIFWQTNAENCSVRTNSSTVSSVCPTQRIHMQNFQNLFNKSN